MAKEVPRVTGVTANSDPRDAIVVAFGRDIPAHYVNPYTGEVCVAATTRTHDFMHVMEDWHRRLAATGENRAAGRAVTGASNAAFLFLALSGLWLWWPRQWAARFLRPALWFSAAKGKARDWNWHNVYGFWFMPVLVVLTASGMVISYRYAAALVRIHETTTGWTTITLREGLPQRRGAPPPPGAPGSSPAPAKTPAPTPPRPPPNPRPAREPAGATAPSAAPAGRPSPTAPRSRPTTARPPSPPPSSCFIPSPAR